MQITVKRKSVYGEEKIYPVCEAAQTFASIAGTKTLTTETISRIKKLGYRVALEQQPSEL